ncbi:MAG: hypothetical protein RIQ63_320, partial [Actinomycetota bacterium]
MRRFVVATSGAGVTTRELRRTANSLVASSGCATAPTKEEKPVAAVVEEKPPEQPKP